MSRQRRAELALFAGATLGSGALALHLGQDVNFDQLSYHVYLGWSLLAGRLEHDLAPAGLGTYLNPLLQAVHFVGMTRLPLRVFFFLLAAVHGLNGFLVYRLARHVLRGVARERTLAALAGLVAASGPCAVSLLGTTFGDNLLSVPVLAAFLQLARVAGDPGRAAARRLALAGALGGAAFGLKLTFAVCLAALLAGALFLALRLRRPRLALWFAAGAAVGAPLTAGFWAWRLWRRFGNPLFPFAGALFPSEYALPTASLDPRWAASGWSDLALVPVQLALGAVERLQEVPARDARHLVLLALAAAAAVQLLRRRLASAPLAGSVAVVGWLALYVAWCLVFHYYRYFAVGELLAPAAILALLRLLRVPALSRVFPALAALLVITASTGSWGRVGWTEGPLRVRVPFDSGATPAIVLVDGYRVSFALPFFPPGVRFLGVTGTGLGFQRRVASELERHHGPVFRLRLRLLPPSDLRALGFADSGACEDVRTDGRGRLVLCRLAPLVAAAGRRRGYSEEPPSAQTSSTGSGSRVTKPSP